MAKLTYDVSVGVTNEHLAAIALHAKIEAIKARVEGMKSGNLQASNGDKYGDHLFLKSEDELFELARQAEQLNEELKLKQKEREEQEQAEERAEAEAIAVQSGAKRCEPVQSGEEIIGQTVGDRCNRNGCAGVLESDMDDVSCSCHINPPCSKCTDEAAVCPICGWYEKDETEE